MLISENFLKIVSCSQNTFIHKLFDRYLYYSDRFSAKCAKKNLLTFLNKYYPDISLTLYDLGAAGGIDSTYDNLVKHHSFKAIGFDPDKEDISSLNPTSKAQVFPFAIAGMKGKRELYLTKSPGSSSLFAPNKKNISEFPISDLFEVTKRLEIDVTTISDFINEFRAPLPDFLKADVQGAEYEVFKSGGDWLSNVIGISFETRLREFYVGEGLFPETHSFLSSKGFRLISRAGRSPHFSGETLEMDVSYVRSIDSLDTEEKIVKALIFCVCHDNPTYAAHLIRRSSLDFNKIKLLLRYLNKDHGFPDEPQTLMMKMKLASLSK